MKNNVDNMLQEWRQNVDGKLEILLPVDGTPPYPLHDAMRYSLFPGGKRIRPLFCLAACHAAGGDDTSALTAAAAVELLHAYTLVHDDLPCMDDDTTRRGKPTVHIKFGEAIAVLTGDALLTMAFEVASAAPVNVNWIVATLARAGGSKGVIAGQVMDISAENPDEKTICAIHQHKTADLIAAAVLMGALSANADEKQLAALTKYGNATGLAFQIIDDLLDSGEPEKQHKELSCLQVWSREKAQLQAANYTATAIDALNEFSTEKAAPLIHLAQSALNRTA